MIVVGWGEVLQANEQGGCNDIRKQTCPLKKYEELPS